jgi:hypothetical protein
MRIVRQLFSLLAWLALCACSPDLDWREYRLPDGGFVVLFPQKPAQSERRLRTPAGEVTMRMYSVRVGEHVLAAGFADFSQSIDAPLVDALRDTLVSNIGGRVTQERPLDSGAAKGREFAATGMLGRGKDARPGVLRARMYASGRRYFQLVSLGGADGMTAADIDLFLASFKPE